MSELFTSQLVADAYEYCIEILEKHCAHYFFHNPEHTKDVFKRATYLAKIEKVDALDLEDLQIATLFHDTGFSIQYAKNEYLGSKIARKWLEERNHPETRIRKIENIIMATIVFSKPKTLLEMIIQDSDMDNIGTEDGMENSLKLEKELKEIAQVKIVGCSYWEYVYHIYADFQFNTQTAKNERTENRLKNVEKLREYVSQFPDCEIPEDPYYMAKII